MRGLFVIIGYILGNKEARDNCVLLLKQASCVIDKQVREIIRDPAKENKKEEDINEIRRVD